MAGEGSQTVIGYVLLNRETGLYWTNRGGFWPRRDDRGWEEKPRVFKTLVGLSASLRGYRPPELFEQWKRENPDQFEYQAWGWIHKELQSRGGILKYMESRWELIPIKI